MTAVFGEPFLHDNILCFFDGRVLSVSGYPLTGGHSLEKPGIADAVRNFFARQQMEMVCAWGPLAPNLDVLSQCGFRRILACPPRPIKAEMVLDCQQVPANNHLNRRLRQARKTPLTVRRVIQPKVQACHLALIEEFYRGKRMTQYLFDQALTLPLMRVSESVSWLECWWGHKLCGLAALGEYFETTNLGLFLARCPDVPGVADLLIYHMILRTMEAGKRYLNLGPSPSEGHFLFKRKWGAVPTVPPYHYVEWARGRLQRSKYSSWTARLIRYERNGA